MREPPIAQMPQITRPHPFGSAAIRQLSEDGIDAIAHPSQHRTPTVSGLGARFAKRSQQHHPEFAQGRLQSGQPVVTITQQQPAGACRHIPDDLAFMLIGRRQVHLGNHAWPTQPQMQAKAIEGLSRGMIFAETGTGVKAMAAVGTGKLADRDRHTIHDSYRRIIEQQRIANQAPQPLFHGPQVGGLPQPGRAMHLCHGRKEMAIVVAEVDKDFLILREAQIRSYQFHGHYFAISQFGHRPSFAHTFAFRDGWQQVVNHDETCDNTLGLPSWCPSSETCTSSESSRLHEPFLWQEYLHIGLASSFASLTA